MDSDAPRKRKKKAGFDASDWPDEGRVNEHGYCEVCHSYWCPHAHPGLYAKRDLKRFYNGSHQRRHAGGRPSAPAPPPRRPTATAPSTDSPEFRKWLRDA